MKNLRRKRGSSSPKSGLCGKPMEDKRAKIRRSWRRRDRSSPSSSSSDSSSSGARIQRRVKKAQKVLERRDPAYRAWRTRNERGSEEKDLRRQAEALAAAMASRFGTMLSAAVRSYQQGYRMLSLRRWGVSGAFQTFPPVPPPGAHLMGGRSGYADCCWKKAHQITGGLVGPPLQRHGPPSRLIVHQKRRAE